MVRALEPHILVGMPHLTPSGLSETWLMKELGHRHWLMLALHLGMDNADFRTPDGDEAYAAICATSITAARFDAVRANDTLTIHSIIDPVSRTQIASRHRLSVAGEIFGMVELISAFVFRAVAGDNHSIARIAMPKMFKDSGKVSQLASSAAALRAGKLDCYLGLRTQNEPVLREFSFEPDASQEFNGAGLFYFAEFQALSDRALGRWFPDHRIVRRRDVFFFGNIHSGEALVVELIAVNPGQLENGVCLRIRRSDGKQIGSVFTWFTSDLGHDQQGGGQNH